MLTCSFAMYPNTENTTNPDKKLVKIFKNTIATAFPQIKYTTISLIKIQYQTKQYHATEL